MPQRLYRTHNLYLSDYLLAFECTLYLNHVTYEDMYTIRMNLGTVSLFTKRSDVLPPHFTKFRSREMGCLMIVSVCNLTDISAMSLLWLLSNCRAIGKVSTRSRGFETDLTRFCGKRSVLVVNRDSGYVTDCRLIIHVVKINLLPTTQNPHLHAQLCKITSSNWLKLNQRYRM